LSWFKDAFRKVHVLYVSPSWVPNRGGSFNAVKMVERMKGARISSFELYAKDHHGFCYYNAHVGPRYPIDVLGEMVEKAHAKGIQVVAYYSVGYDNYAAAQHPDWTCRDLDGRQVKTRDLFTWMCFNSGYRRYMLEQIQEVVGYDVDGLWLDIFGFFWIRFPPAYADVSHRFPMPTCYCHNCRVEFRKKYGIDLPESFRDSLIDEVQEFHKEANASFLRDVRKLLKGRRPEALLSFNWCGVGYSPEVSELVDFLSAEAHPPDYLRQGFTCRYLRSRGKPYQMHTAGSLSGWSSWDTKPLNLLILESSIAVAHAASPNIGLNPYPDGSWEEGQLKALEELYGYIEAREKYLRDVESPAEVAILYGEKAPWAPTDPSVMGGLSALIGFNEVLTEEHYQFKFTDGSEGLSRYRLVVIPDQYLPNPRQIELVRDYVKDGGNVILTYRTSLYDAHGKQLPNFTLSDVMGLDFAGFSRYSGAYAVLDKRISDGIPAQPMVFNSLAVETRERGAEKLASLVNPMAEQTAEVRILWGGPANPPGEVTESVLVGLNRYGKGRCVYIAFPIGRDIAEKATEYGGVVKTWWKKLAANIVRLLAPEDLIQTDAPPGVEVVLNRQGNRYVTHLINHYVGTPSYLAPGDNIPSFNVTLDFDVERMKPFAEVSLVTGGNDAGCHPIKAEWTDRRLRVKVPSLHVYCIVVLE